MSFEPNFLGDAHVHLQDERLHPFLEEALVEARSAGIACWVCNGTREQDWSEVLSLAGQNEGILPCLGLHPWFVKERSQNWLSRLEKILHETKACVGEIGLDRWVAGRDESTQEACFREQLRVAVKLDRPVSIHCVRAWDWLMKVLREEPVPKAGFLLHAYSGPVELIEPLADRGAYFSFAGTVLQGNKGQAHHALRMIPSERLLLETDAPDLLPPRIYRCRERKGRSGTILNEPVNLSRILPGVALLLDLSEDILRKQLQENMLRLFGGFLIQCMDHGKRAFRPN